MTPRVAMFLILVSALSARGGLDLTPAVSNYESAGFKYQRLVFSHDQQRIEYEPPSGWTVRGDVTRLFLTSRQGNSPDAIIEAAPLDQPAALDEKRKKGIDDQLVATLPPGSQFIKIEERLENSVLVDGNPSYQVTISYHVGAQKIRRIAIFTQTRDTQLIFRLTAPQDDFDALYRQFKTSLFSWHWLELPVGSQRVAAAESGAVQR